MNASLPHCERSMTLNVPASGWSARRTSTEARTTSRSSWHVSRSREARSPRMPPDAARSRDRYIPSGAVGSSVEPREHSPCGVGCGGGRRVMASQPYHSDPGSPDRIDPVSLEVSDGTGAVDHFDPFPVRLHQYLTPSLIWMIAFF